ncbi:MAG TPA: hypothetical protein VIV64_07830 [Gammaproteobacteria bacterium]
MAEYEFSEEDNKTFDLLARALRRFALTFAVFAVILTILGSIWIAFITAGTPDSPTGSPAVGGAPWLIIVVYAGIPATAALALMFLRPLDNLKRITATEGRDISELLGALGDLNQSFGLLRMFVALLFIAMVIRVAILLFG